MNDVTTGEGKARGEAAVPLRRLIGFGALGQLTYVAAQFGILLALSRLTTVADVGRYGLASAIVTPIFLMFGFGFRVNQATASGVQHSFREFEALRTWTSFLAFTIVGILCLFTVDRATGFIVLAFAASRGIENRCNLLYGLFQKHDRMDLVARSLVVRGIGGTTAFTAILWLTRQPAAALFAMFAVWAAMALLHDQRIANRMIAGTEEERPPTRAGLIAILRTSWPIAVSSLLAGAQMSSPRLAINHLLSIEALGLFTTVAYAFQAINTVNTAVTQSMLARLTHFRRTGRVRALFRVLHTALAGLAVIGAVSAVGAWLLGDWVLGTILGEKYAHLGSLLALCILAGTISAAVTILQAGISSTRRFNLVMITRFVGVALVVIGSVLGASTIGLAGVVIAMGAASLGQCIVMYGFLLRHANDGVNDGTATES